VEGHQDACHTFHSAQTFARVQGPTEFQTAPQFRIFLPVRLRACEYTHGVQDGIAGEGRAAAALVLLHLLLELIFVLLVALGQGGFGATVRVSCLLSFKLLDPVKGVEKLVPACELLKGLVLFR